jgi:hypothetical protein
MLHLLFEEGVGHFAVLNEIGVLISKVMCILEVLINYCQWHRAKADNV